MNFSVLKGFMPTGSPFVPKLTFAVADMFQPVFRIHLFTTTWGCFNCWKVSVNGICQSR